jgi:hypothetical protein
VRRFGDASYSIASRKILDQRVANLENCCDCKRKGLPNGLITSPLTQDYSFAAVTASGKGLVGWFRTTTRMCRSGQPGVVDFLKPQARRGRTTGEERPVTLRAERIVAKVDELMALCDRLEASLDTATATRRQLLDALLHEALEPAAEALAAAE